MTERKVQATAENVQGSRREFIRKAAYVAPAILTLAVAPRYAKAGSEKDERVQEWKEKLEEFEDKLEDWFEWWRNRT